MASVLCLDPGLTTGVAIFRSDRTGCEYETLELTTQHAVWGLVLSNPWDTVVCESFASGGAISSHGFMTIRLIGGVQALCFEHNIPIVLRPNQARLAYVEEATKILEKRGLKKSKVDHQIAALAHLLAWKGLA